MLSSLHSYIPSVGLFICSHFSSSQNFNLDGDCGNVSYLFDFRNPAAFLHAYTCLPLAYGTRQAAGAILQDVADSGVLFAILMCKHKVEAPSSF